MEDNLAFNAKRKFRGAVLAVIATHEMHHRLACRARHATVFTMSDTKHQANERYHDADFNPRRKFRAAVYVILACKAIQHWIDSEETLLFDPTLRHHYKHPGMELTEGRSVGKKFNPRRRFKAAVYAVMFVNELQYSSLDMDPDKVHLLPSKVRSQVELRAHVKEMLRWLGGHPTRPSFVHQFYMDANAIHSRPKTVGGWLVDHMPSRNPKRKMRSAVYAVMAVNKMMADLRHKKLEVQVKERLDWLSMHIPTKICPVHDIHKVHFNPHDEATIHVVHHTKDFEAKRKALGDTVFVRSAGMLPEHELRRSYSTE